uniref:EF-hand domain-containing protein n=1 Tax=Esox lucius TaxID=8010 RepID=A0A6Q2Z8A4_ESOLU
MAMDRESLCSLFDACDADNSGKIEKDEFIKICSELNVPPSEREHIFSKLDIDRDGTIDLADFISGFHGISEQVFEGETDSDTWEVSSQAWEDFQTRLGDHAKFIPRREQAATLYQNIHLTEPRMVSQYERVIMSFTSEIKQHNAEIENLALAVKRAQDKAAMQLSEMEEEMETRIRAAENKTRQQVSHTPANTHTDTHTHTHTDRRTCTMVAFKTKVAGVRCNQRLKQELMQSHTNIAFLQSELDSLKSDLTDHSINLERDEAMMRGFSEERENLERQIKVLLTANRKLHDSNDGLRSSLENTHSKSNKRCNSASPVSSLSRRKSICYSTPYFERALCGVGGSLHRRRASLDTLALALCDPAMQGSFEVDSLPESCLDSGMSTLRGSHNGYDSEQEVKGHEDEEEEEEQKAMGSDSGSVQDWKPSEPVSQPSSTRKALSAITTEVQNCSVTSEKAYRVVLAGDAAVGKSSFLLRLCKNEFRGTTSATLGVDFQMKTLVVDGELTVLQLWDTAGQERFRSIAKSYFRRADGVLLLYDVTCEKSFLNVREWVDLIQDVSQEHIPIMLVGNKCDLRQEALQNGTSCIPTSYGEKLSMSYSALFCETSAKDGSNVIEAVLHLARKVTKQAHIGKNKETVTNLHKGPNKKMSGATCCA